MNALAFGWQSALHWDVLQFVSVSFLLLALINRHSTPWILPLLVLLTPLITPPLRSLLAKHPTYLTAVLVGSQSSGAYWPLFPWFAVVATGFLVERERRRLGPSIALPLCTCGFTLLGISLLIGRPTVELDPLQIWGSKVFQPPTSVVFSTIAVYFILTSLAIWIRPLLRLPKYGIVRSLSKGVLFVYIIHTIVGYPTSSVFQVEVPLDVSIVLFPLLILLLSWGVGAITVFMQSNRIVLTFSKEGGR